MGSIEIYSQCPTCGVECSEQTHQCCGSTPRRKWRHRLGPESEVVEEQKPDSPFVQAVNRCCESLNVYPGARPGCDECGLSEVTDCNDPAVEMAEEGSFSWHSCDTCGTSLGGMRTPGHGTARDGTHVHLSICCDCVVYLANGDEPEDWKCAP